MTKPVFPPVRGTRDHARLPAALLALLLAICLAAGWAPPAGHQSYLLEVVPGLAAVAFFAAVYRRFPMSHLVYGGIYTYAETPLGNWARDTFHLSRNHYDRVGHLALGFFPALTIREVLLRRTPLAPGGWFTFITLSIVLAIGAFWELVEWWTTLVVAGDVGTAFLGSQGDPWDAQWDMLLALVGAALSLPLLSRAHDRSMRRAGILAEDAPPA